MQILIVEDEKRLADVLGQLCREQRWQADVVYTGTDGLEYARSGQYDAVVLDVMLPGMVVPKETLLTRVWGAESDAEDNNAEGTSAFCAKSCTFWAAGWASPRCARWATGWR